MTGEKKKVLVVEDDPLLTDLFAQKLAKDFVFLHAPTGEMALDQVKKEAPDLVLLDILLPGIDGFEVLRQIKADQATASTRVIILSNLGSPEDMKKGTELGAEKFIVKVSLSLSEVHSLVKSVLGSPEA